MAVTQIHQLGDARFKFIDQLRALAILPVIAVHTFYSTFPGGGIGIGIFFAISGFLIGGLLLEEPNFRPLSGIRFVLRRVVRIYPAYIASILLILLLSAISMPERMKLILQILPGLGIFIQPSNRELLGIGVQIYWTLYIEFAFYLFAPLFLLLFGQTRGLMILCLSLLISSGISAVFVTQEGILLGDPGGFTHFGGAIAQGALVALAWKEGLLNRSTDRQGVLLAGCLGGIFILLFVPQISPRIFLAEIMAASLLSCGLIIAFIRNPSLGVFAVAAWIGKISYSLYLIHGIVLDYMRPVLGLTQNEKIIFFVPIVLTLSTISYYWIEIPTMRIGKLLISKLKGRT